LSAFFDNVAAWMRANRLQLNPAKTEVLHWLRSPERIDFKLAVFVYTAVFMDQRRDTWLIASNVWPTAAGNNCAFLQQRR
jgi:hypothetical protein